MSAPLHGQFRPPRPRTLVEQIRADCLNLDYASANPHWALVSEGQTVVFLHAVGSIGAQGGPPRQPRPVLGLINHAIGVEIVSGNPYGSEVARYRDWFARLQQDGAHFDLIAFRPDGIPTDAARVHVYNARIFGDPDITPMHVECWVAVDRVESIDPYVPPPWDPASGV